MTPSKTIALTLLLFIASAVFAQQNLSFQALDGKPATLSSMRGRVVVLMFAGVQDPQCRDEFKALEALGERFRDKEVSIYWVSINPVSAASDERLRSQCGGGTNVAILRDSNQSAFKHFGGAQLPTAVTLDRTGKVQGRPRGGFNPNADFVNDLAAIVDSLLGKK